MHPVQYNWIYDDLCLIFLGCDSTRYMPGCYKPCPTKCRYQHCDVFNGSCIYGCSGANALTLDCIGKQLDWILAIESLLWWNIIIRGICACNCVKCHIYI